MVIRACEESWDTICGTGLQVILEVQGVTQINTTLWQTLFGNISVQREQINATVSKVPCEGPSQYRNDSGWCVLCKQCGSRAVEVLPCRVGEDRVCQGYILWELEAAGVTGIPNQNNLSLGYNASWAIKDASQYLVEKMPCWPGYYRGDDGVCYACKACKRPWEIEVSACRTQSDTICVPDLKVMLGIDGLSWKDRESLLNKLAMLLNISNSSIEFEDASSLTVSTPLQVIAEVNGIEQADAKLILAALNRSGILAQTVEVKSGNEITITKLPCPAGQFRADMDSLCVACKICPDERIEVRPCTTQSDRMCGQSLNVGLYVNNTALWQMNQAILIDAIGMVLLGNGSVVPAFEYYLHEEVDISISKVPCIPGQEYTGSDRLCHACTKCGALEEEVRGCQGSEDRVCRGKIQVDLGILGAAGIDTSQWDLSKVQADLAIALGYGGELLHSYALQYARPNISITVAPIPCPANTFINLTLLACQECSVCALNMYASPACGGMQDALCHPCSLCNPWDNLVEACGNGHDTICEGLMDISVRIDNVTGLDADMLQTLLAQAVYQVPGVDQGYLDRWMDEHNSMVKKVFAPYEIIVEALDCHAGFYQDNLTATCKTCSICASGAYVIQECAWDADTVCGACETCILGEYEACPCGSKGDLCPTGNRVCFAYPLQSWEIEVIWLSQYDSVCLGNTYIPRFIQSIQIQLMAGEAGVASHTLELLEGEVITLSDGSMQGLGVRVYPLFPNCTVSQGGLYIHNITVYLHNIYAQLPNTDQAFDTLFERALQFADAQFSVGKNRRRLLQYVSSNCPEDTYPYDYGGILSTLCIPCVDDPVITATEITPPALRWAITSHPCPNGFARTCFGGATQPVCVIRNGAAALLSSRAALTSITCPVQQLLVLEPTTLNPICIGAPCYPGTTGQPGQCIPCTQGTYKSTTGSLPCTDCPQDTYNPDTQAIDDTACIPCPSNQSAPTASAACLCDPGYTGNSCDPCIPGTFKLIPGPSVCRACPSGSYSQATGGVACDACATGTFSQEYGSTICTQCVIDSYQNRLGGSTCYQCGPGFISSEERLGCIPCPAGTHESTGSCIACEANQVSGMGQDACQVCPIGLGYLDGLCIPCPQGYAQNTLGTCEECPVNTYYSDSTCSPCPSRTFTAASGQISCTPCAPGTHGDACQPCSPGTYSTGYAQTACLECKRGKYTQAYAASSESTCVNCVAGTYWQDRLCKNCPENTESPPAATAVTECLAVQGSYALPGQPGSPCPQDTYCVRGAMQPSPCPTGSTSTPGSHACTHAKQPILSRLLLWDWIVPPIWGVMVLLGVGCVMRNRSLLRRRLPVLPVKLRYYR